MDLLKITGTNEFQPSQVIFLYLNRLNAFFLCVVTFLLNYIDEMFLFFIFYLLFMYFYLLFIYFYLLIFLFVCS